MRSVSIARVSTGVISLGAVCMLLAWTYRLSETGTKAFVDPATEGQWSSVYTLNFSDGRAGGTAAVHMHVLPNGKVLLWDQPLEEVHTTNTWIWDPTQAVSGNSINDSDVIHIPNNRSGCVLFCSGHAFLPDGRLFVAGGGHGQTSAIAQTNIFDYRNNSWTPGPDMPLVPTGESSGAYGYPNSEAQRWYPTVTPLATGELLIASGQTGGNTTNHTPIVYKRDGTWQILPASGSTPAGAPWEPWYPFLFAAPNGTVYRAGGSLWSPAGGDRSTGYLNTVTGVFTTTGQVTDYVYGSAVMYEPGKILRLGGGQSTEGCFANNAQSAAKKIDLNQPSPSWQDVPGNDAREFLNATILADGQVLVTGGASTAAAYIPRLWNPTTGSWTSMASMARARAYHSTAVLLPDGRVIVGGTRTSSSCDQPNIEIFSPPYLSQGARPTIAYAPSQVRSGQKFVISTPDTGISSVSWVRLSSVTHSFNMNQRFVKSTVIQMSSVGNAINGALVQTPTANEAPPGHYLLFLIKNGVPSVASIIRIAAADEPAFASDFTGNGSTDLVWHDSATGGANAYWQLNGQTVLDTQNLLPANPDLSWEIRAVGDLNGDGRPDLIWQKPSTGDVATWLYREGLTPLHQFVLLDKESDANWKIVGAGDMDRDGQTDLVWRYMATTPGLTGKLRIWHMDGWKRRDFVDITVTGEAGSSPWQVVGIADMNMDSWPDLVWRYNDTTTGYNAAWLLNDNVVIGTPLVATTGTTDPWRIMAVTDVARNGVRDGHPDLLWQRVNSSTSDVAVWFMTGPDGLTPSEQYLLSVSPIQTTTYRIVGAR